MEGDQIFDKPSLGQIIGYARKDALLKCAKLIMTLDPSIEISLDSTTQNLRKEIQKILDEHPKIRVLIPGMEHLGEDRPVTPLLDLDHDSEEENAASPSLKFDHTRKNPNLLIPPSTSLSRSMDPLERDIRHRMRFQPEPVKEDSNKIIKFLQEARARGIKFSGSPNEGVTIFLRKFEQLASLFQLTGELRLTVINDLLGGSAERWFRIHINDWISWEIFRKRFVQVYGSLDQDAIILEKMLRRKQVEGERPIHFISTILDMNDTLDVPQLEKTILNIAKNNLLPEYQKGLALMPICNFSDLEIACQNLESVFIRSQKFQPPESSLLTDPEFGDLSLVDGNEGSCSAVQGECFHCHQQGHFMRDCPERKKRVTFHTPSPSNPTPVNSNLSVQQMGQLEAKLETMLEKKMEELWKKFKEEKESGN